LHYKLRGFVEKQKVIGAENKKAQGAKK